MMKYSHLKILGEVSNSLNSNQDSEQQFDDRKQIQQLRFIVKKHYFKKRALFVDTLIQMLQENKRPTEQAKTLKLPDDIQKQRQQYFTISEKFKKRRQIQDQHQEEDDYLKEEPFSKIKQRIFKKYKLKRQYVEEMKNKVVIEDSLQIQKKIIQDIYRNKLKQYYEPHKNQLVSDNEQSYQVSSNMAFHKNLFNNFKQKVNELDEITGDNISRSQQNYQGAKIVSPPHKKIQESIVIQSKKNPNNDNYMKINDPYNVNSATSNAPLHTINDSIDNQADLSFKEAQKRLNASFQQSGYKNFVLEQKRQLQEQKKRMQKLTEQANKVISNENFTDSDQQKNVVRSQFLSKNEQILLSKDSISTDQTHREINQAKCLFNELIELFILSEIIKFQICNRTFEMISKLYQYASKYYNQKIEVVEPISSDTFSLAVKSLLKDQYELRSEIDLVVNKIFEGKNSLLFEELTHKLKSTLNKKQASMFESVQAKNEVDRTIQKTKRLFVTWISMNYFTKKIKQTLRKKKFIVTTIMKQCALEYDSQNFDSGLLSQFFSQGVASNTQKLKIDVFFRHIIGAQLKRKNFIEWYSNQNVYSSRYERIGAKLTKSIQG